MVPKFIRKPFRYININSVIILVLINVVFFFTLDNFFVYVRLPDSPVQYRMSVSYIMALNKNFCIDMKFFWQPFTYMFVHGDLNHLLSNMIGLLLFGFSVEKAIGSKEFILFYGEVLQYYFIIEEKGEERRTKEKTLIVPSNCQPGETKYQMINCMLAARQQGREEELKKAIERYEQLDIWTSSLFQLME